MPQVVRASLCQSPGHIQGMPTLFNAWIKSGKGNKFFARPKPVHILDLANNAGSNVGSDARNGLQALGQITWCGVCHFPLEVPFGFLERFMHLFQRLRYVFIQLITH